MSSSSGAYDSPSSSSSLPTLASTSKVWIGNLGSKISEAHVLKLAKPFGAIAKLDFVYGLNDKNERVPRGFAFVTYCDPSGARRAVASLNGTQLLGRTLRVNLANPSRKELRALMGMNGKRKKSLEETRKEQQQVAKRTREAEPSKQDTIRALEDKLKSMHEAEQFKLAVGCNKRTCNDSGSSSSASRK